MSGLGIIIWLVIAAAIYFLFRWLGRIGRRHAVASWGGRRLQSADGLNRLFCRRYHRLGSTEIDLPAAGGVIVVSNHISGLDPVAMIAASARPLRFLIAKEQYHRFYLHWFLKRLGLIPVDRTGRPDKALRAAQRALESGEAIAIFPQGGITTEKDRQRKLKRGAVFLAEQTGVPVVPVRISGVAAKGWTIVAIFVRSRIVIEQGAILPADMPADEKMQAIEEFITP